MAEYIEKEAAINTMKNAQFEYTSEEAAEFISHINPADAQPVRHGRWGKYNDCSECGCQPWYERDIHTLKYCPNCGAKMDSCP